MEPASSMLPSELDVRRIDSPTDRRPDFTAEALSPHFRIGLLLATLVAELGLVASVVTAAVSPGALLHGGIPGVLLVGGTLTLTFAVFLVFGALVANNPRVGARARIAWYAVFVLLGPVMIPIYWLMHVWPAPFEPDE